MCTPCSSGWASDSSSRRRCTCALRCASAAFRSSPVHVPLAKSCHSVRISCRQDDAATSTPTCVIIGDCPCVERRTTVPSGMSSDANRPIPPHSSVAEWTRASTLMPREEPHRRRSSRAPAVHGTEVAMQSEFPPAECSSTPPAGSPPFWKPMGVPPLCTRTWRTASTLAPMRRPEGRLTACSGRGL
jgi:hypothetical protein